MSDSQINLIISPLSRSDVDKSFYAVAGGNSIHSSQTALPLPAPVSESVPSFRDGRRAETDRNGSALLTTPLLGVTVSHVDGGGNAKAGSNETMKSAPKKSHRKRRKDIAADKSGSKFASFEDARSDEDEEGDVSSFRMLLTHRPRHSVPDEPRATSVGQQSPANLQPLPSGPSEQHASTSFSQRPISSPTSTTEAGTLPSSALLSSITVSRLSAGEKGGDGGGSGPYLMHSPLTAGAGAGGASSAFASVWGSHRTHPCFNAPGSHQGGVVNHFASYMAHATAASTALPTQPFGSLGGAGWGETTEVGETSLLASTGGGSGGVSGEGEGEQILLVSLAPATAKATQGHSGFMGQRCVPSLGSQPVLRHPQQQQGLLPSEAQQSHQAKDEVPSSAVAGPPLSVRPNDNDSYDVSTTRTESSSKTNSNTAPPSTESSISFQQIVVNKPTTGADANRLFRSAGLGSSNSSVNKVARVSKKTAPKCDTPSISSAAATITTLRSAADSGVNGLVSPIVIEGGASRGGRGGSSSRSSATTTTTTTTAASIMGVQCSVGPVLVPVISPASVTDVARVLSPLTGQEEGKKSAHVSSAVAIEDIVSPNSSSGAMDGGPTCRSKSSLNVQMDVDPKKSAAASPPVAAKIENTQRQRQAEGAPQPIAPPEGRPSLGTSVPETIQCIVGTVAGEDDEASAFVFQHAPSLEDAAFPSITDRRRSSAGPLAFSAVLREGAALAATATGSFNGSDGGGFTDIAGEDDVGNDALRRHRPSDTTAGLESASSALASSCSHPPPPTVRRHTQQQMGSIAGSEQLVPSPSAATADDSIEDAERVERKASNVNRYILAQQLLEKEEEEKKKLLLADTHLPAPTLSSAGVVPKGAAPVLPQYSYSLSHKVSAAASRGSPYPLPPSPSSNRAGGVTGEGTHNSGAGQAAATLSGNPLHPTLVNIATQQQHAQQGRQLGSLPPLHPEGAAGGGGGGGANSSVSSQQTHCHSALIAFVRSDSPQDAALGTSRSSAVSPSNKPRAASFQRTDSNGSNGGQQYRFPTSTSAFPPDGMDGGPHNGSTCSIHNYVGNQQVPNIIGGVGAEVADEVGCDAEVANMISLPSNGMAAFGVSQQKPIALLQVQSLEPQRTGIGGGDKGAPPTPSGTANVRSLLPDVSVRSSSSNTAFQRNRRVTTPAGDTFSNISHSMSAAMLMSGSVPPANSLIGRSGPTGSLQDRSQRGSSGDYRLPAPPPLYRMNFDEAVATAKHIQRRGLGASIASANASQRSHPTGPAIFSHTAATHHSEASATATANQPQLRPFSAPTQQQYKRQTPPSPQQFPPNSIYHHSISTVISEAPRSPTTNHNEGHGRSQSRHSSISNVSFLQSPSLMMCRSSGNGMLLVGGGMLVTPHTHYYQSTALPRRCSEGSVQGSSTTDRTDATTPEECSAFMHEGSDFEEIGGALNSVAGNDKNNTNTNNGHMPSLQIDAPQINGPPTQSPHERGGAHSPLSVTVVHSNPVSPASLPKASPPHKPTVQSGSVGAQQQAPQHASQKQSSVIPGSTHRGSASVLQFWQQHYRGGEDDSVLRPMSAGITPAVRRDSADDSNAPPFDKPERRAPEDLAVNQLQQTPLLHREIFGGRRTQPALRRSSSVPLLENNYEVILSQPTPMEMLLGNGIVNASKGLHSTKPLPVNSGNTRGAMNSPSFNYTTLSDVSPLPTNAGERLSTSFNQPRLFVRRGTHGSSCVKGLLVGSSHNSMAGGGGSQMASIARRHSHTSFGAAPLGGSNSLSPHQRRYANQRSAVIVEDDDGYGGAVLPLDSRFGAFAMEGVAAAQRGNGGAPSSYLQPVLSISSNAGAASLQGSSPQLVLGGGGPRKTSQNALHTHVVPSSSAGGPPLSPEGAMPQCTAVCVSVEEGDALALPSSNQQQEEDIGGLDSTVGERFVDALPSVASAHLLTLRDTSCLSPMETKQHNNAATSDSLTLRSKNASPLQGGAKDALNYSCLASDESHITAVRGVPAIIGIDPPSGSGNMNATLGGLEGSRYCFHASVHESFPGWDGNDNEGEQSKKAAVKALLLKNNLKGGFPLDGFFSSSSETVTTNAGASVGDAASVGREMAPTPLRQLRVFHSQQQKHGGAKLSTKLYDRSLSGCSTGQQHASTGGAQGGNRANQWLHDSMSLYEDYGLENSDRIGCIPDKVDAMLRERERMLAEEKGEGDAADARFNEMNNWRRPITRHHRGERPRAQSLDSVTDYLASFVPLSCAVLPNGAVVAPSTSKETHTNANRQPNEQRRGAGGIVYVASISDNAALEASGMDALRSSLAWTVRDGAESTVPVSIAGGVGGQSTSQRPSTATLRTLHSISHHGGGGSSLRSPLARSPQKRNQPSGFANSSGLNTLQLNGAQQLQQRTPLSGPSSRGAGLLSLNSSDAGGPATLWAGPAPSCMLMSEDSASLRFTASSSYRGANQMITAARVGSGKNNNGTSAVNTTYVMPLNANRHPSDATKAAIRSLLSPPISPPVSHAGGGPDRTPRPSISHAHPPFNAHISPNLPGGGGAVGLGDAASAMESMVSYGALNSNNGARFANLRLPIAFGSSCHPAGSPRKVSHHHRQQGFNLPYPAHNILGKAPTDDEPSSNFADNARAYRGVQVPLNSTMVFGGDGIKSPNNPLGAGDEKARFTPPLAGLQRSSTNTPRDGDIGSDKGYFSGAIPEGEAAALVRLCEQRAPNSSSSAATTVSTAFGRSLQDQEEHEMGRVEGGDGLQLEGIALRNNKAVIANDKSDDKPDSEGIPTLTTEPATKESVAAPPPTTPSQLSVDHQRSLRPPTAPALSGHALGPKGLPLADSSLLKGGSRGVSAHPSVAFMSNIGGAAAARVGPSAQWRGGGDGNDNESANSILKANASATSTNNSNAVLPVAAVLPISNRLAYSEFSAASSSVGDGRGVVPPIVGVEGVMGSSLHNYVHFPLPPLPPPNFENPTRLVCRGDGSFDDGHDLRIPPSVVAQSVVPALSIVTTGHMGDTPASRMMHPAHTPGTLVLRGRGSVSGNEPLIGLVASTPLLPAQCTLASLATVRRAPSTHRSSPKHSMSSPLRDKRVSNNDNANNASISGFYSNMPTQDDDCDESESEHSSEISPDSFPSAGDATASRLR